MSNECLKHLKESITINYDIKHPIRHPMKDTIEKLIEASEILLRHYDGHGWELLYYAKEAAKLIEIEPKSIIEKD